MRRPRDDAQLRRLAVREAQAFAQGGQSGAGRAARFAQADTAVADAGMATRAATLDAHLDASALFGRVDAVARSDLPVHQYLPSDDPRWPLLLEVAVVTAFSAWSSLDDEWQ